MSGTPGSEQPLTVLSTQPPAEDKINGVLLGFRLRYRELVYDSLRGFTLRGIGNPGATWAELTRECLQPCRAWGRVAGRWPSGGGWRTGQGSILRSVASPRYQPGAVRVRLCPVELSPAPSCHQVCGP